MHMSIFIYFILQNISNKFENTFDIVGKIELLKDIILFDM